MSAMSGRCAVAILALAVLTLLAARPALADDPPGAIVFARGDALWRIDPRGAGEPTRIAGVGAGEIADLRSSPDGQTLLFERDGASYWVRPGDGTATAQRLACTTPARLSPDGNCVACIAEDGRVTFHVLGPAPRTTRRPVRAPYVSFLDPAGLAVMFPHQGALWGMSIRNPRKRRQMAAHYPDSHLLPAPDGARAVGVYDDPDERTEADGKDKRDYRRGGNGDAGATLFTFPLDGEGVRRRLNRGAVPVQWSADSQWLLLQEGSSACLVRGVGGEYKCWNRYRALSIAPDGSWVLLARRADDDDSENEQAPWVLYRGERDGVRAKTPRRIIGNTEGAAVWVP